MENRYRLFCRLFAVVFIFFITLETYTQSPKYIVVDLGSLGGTLSDAYAINDAGRVVGFSRDALSRNRAFIWSEGVMQNLGTLGGQTSWAYSINKSGQVVGIAQTFQEKNLAFLWHNGTMQNLGIGTVSSRAEGINDSGSVVGGRNDEGIPQRAFLWTDGELTDLGTLGGSTSFAYDINNNFQIVGESRNEDGLTRPFIWENGVMSVLEQLGDSHGSALAINDVGQIVGSKGNHAFFWSNGNVQTLDMLGTSSSAFGINDFGEVVGVYSDGGFRAFHWHNGIMRDLNDLIDPESGWHLSHARDINNAGSIVGRGTYLGQTKPFLLIPIPEKIVYVHSGHGSDFNSGASWEYPLASLHRALDIVKPGQEIWVAAGVYTPTDDPTDRDTSFVLKNGVSVYGGFSGLEASLSERDVTGNPTILSGDINGSGDLSGNSYHVVNAVGTSRSAVLDGFIITGGNANVEFDYPRNVGGGIYYDGGSPTLSNLVITGNNAIASGGGMFCIDGGSPVLTNVIISHNSAGNLGGAISGGTRANPVFINVTVANNAAGATGGLYFSGDIDATLTNVIIWGNENEQVRSHGTLRISQSLIQGGLENIAGDKAVIDNRGNIDADPLFRDPAEGDFRLLPDSPAINGGTNAPFLPGGISENVTTDLDGNQRIIHGTVDMGAYEWEYTGESIIFVNASAAGNNDGTNWENAYVHLYSALWTVNVVGSALIDEIWVAGGTFKPTNDPLNRTQSFRLFNGVAVYGGFTGTEEYVHQRDWISNPTILSGDINNTGDFNGNSYHVVYGSGVDDTAVLDGFIITGGNADGTGINGFGGGIRTNASGPLLSNLIVHGNRAAGNQGGGGIFDSGSNGPLYKNVIVSGNRSAGNGGGITLSSGSSARFVNVTVSGNRADGNGGGVYITSTGGNPELTNVILWGNRADAEADELYVTSAEVTVSYCLIRGGMDGAGVNLLATTFNDGGGNFDGHPVFVQATAPSLAPTTEGDYRLESVSAAIDAGTNTAVSTLMDLDGNQRIVGGRVDIGAYEFQSAEILSAKEITRNNVPYDFDDTHISMRFVGSVAGESPLLFVDYYNGEAENIAYEDTTSLVHTSHRWVIAHAGGGFVNATLSFNNVSGLDEIDNPAAYSIYRREEVGEGTFTKLNTSADGDRLFSVVTSFGEFILAREDEPVSVDDTYIADVPEEFSLYQNYPNPFNPSTTIRYDIPQESHVLLEVYNVLGQRVAVLVDEFRQAGSYTAHFDAGNVSSGIYIYRLKAGDSVLSGNMVLMR